MESSSRYNVFAHLTAEKSGVYRAALNVFVQAKARFVIHLRPADVRHQLAEEGISDAEEAGIEAVLQQLLAWGNLESHPDTTEVLTVQDFWRVRNLYQMSTGGEAAEAALLVFEQSIRQPGELQVAALDDIRRHLAQVALLSEQDEPDDAEIFNTFSLLRQRFDELTAQAQRFIGGLQRRIELQGLNVESFLEYKQRLIDYLERFLSQLVLAAHEIAMTILAMKPERIDPLLVRVADRELVDRLIVNEDDRTAARRAWRERWLGLRSWFVGSDGRASQAEELRGAARAAIPSLVAAVAGINDRRAGRSDRAADLRALAVWFAEAEDDRVAHRLWRGAFGLDSCRHLSIDNDTLEQREVHPVPSTTRWVDAPPLRISLRLHSTGRYVARGRPLSVIDRSEEKELLRRLATEEAEQIGRSREVLANGRRMRLSELEELPTGAFDLFLDLLGEALAAKASPDSPVSVTSSDGSLHIDLERTEDRRVAVIRTTAGVLVGEDHYITIRPTLDDVGPGVHEPVADSTPAIAGEA